MNDKKLEEFKNFLQASGAAVQLTTNPFELVSFKTRNGKSIIYINKYGDITSYSTEEAHEALDKFRKGKPWKSVDRKRKHLTAYKKNIAVRDGKACFFCGEEFAITDLTVEHLLSFSHGGTDNINNLCLACKDCNEAVGNGSIVSKIKFRDQKRCEVHVSTT